MQRESAVEAAVTQARHATTAAVSEEYEAKIQALKEELAGQARAARLREQMLNAVMSDEVDKARATAAGAPAVE